MDQLPVFIKRKDVSDTKEQSDSLVGRGLASVKTNILSRIDQDVQYRKARDAYNMITNDGKKYCIGICWAEDELKALNDVFDIFKQLADCGYGKSYFPLSLFYQGGQSIPENKAFSQRYAQLAFLWCFDNRLQNEPDIWNDLGTLYLLGEVVAEDYALAMLWYRQAADAGDPTGLFNVSCMYELGRGVELDYEEALHWQFRAAEAGHHFAQAGLAYQYEHGNELIDQDDEKAFYWYLQAAKGGLKRAIYGVAKYSNSGFGIPNGDNQALEWFLNKAKCGEMWAQFFLADTFEIGLGVVADIKTAIYWYLQAAEQGDVRAQTNLAHIYYDMPDEDFDTAVYWFHKAAEQGYDSAQWGYGNLHEVDYEDYETAMELYHKAAAQGDRHYQWALGMKYFCGDIVKINYMEAEHWLHESANQGYGPAQYMLGKIFETGLVIAPPNITEAVLWYKSAAESGHKLAQKRLSELGIDWG